MEKPNLIVTVGNHIYRKHGNEFFRRPAWWKYLDPFNGAWVKHPTADVPFMAVAELVTA